MLLRTNKGSSYVDNHRLLDVVVADKATGGTAIGYPFINKHTESYNGVPYHRLGRGEGGGRVGAGATFLPHNAQSQTMTMAATLSIQNI